MAQQIVTLTNDLAELKQHSATRNQLDHFERQISLDVASTAPSEVSNSRVSRQLSSLQYIARPISQCRPILEESNEPPFWKVQLQRAGENWDQGNGEDFRRGSLRCVSPMTMY